jgi:undecaprenyl-diphosphatase
LSVKKEPENPTDLSRASSSARANPGLTIFGLLILVTSTVVFGLLAEDVTNGEPLTILDERFSNWLHAHGSAQLTTLLLLVTRTHSHLTITVATLLLGAWWWNRRFRERVLILMLAVFGGMFLNLLLKHLFLRARPEWHDPLLILTTYSFPSGHTMIATVFYGSLCAFVFTSVRNWLWRVLVIVDSVLMISLVGFSRIYLGVHYLSDVLAAIAEGLAWLAFSFLAVDFVQRRRSKRSGKSSPTPAV